MNAHTKSAQVVLNAAYDEAATPHLSVLVPFYRESPSTLLKALKPVAGVEIILLDDGSQQPDLTQDVLSTIDDLALPVKFITLPANEGRARGRNRLTSAARGNYFLCLDSDMLPDHPDFLERWITVTQDNPAVVFGGFSLLQAPQDKAFAVHRLMAGKSDCLDAATRSLQPEKYVFTSNLLIRRDVFKAQDFDASFTGWGWEDVEWAMRVANDFGVRHIDNTATHMGLDRAEILARKYEQSVGNFARVIKKHPEVVAQYPSYKIARLIRRLPMRGALRATVKSIGLNDNMPLKLRALALRVYRAALYAEVV
ncbi:glycosyltransferase family 2 protein [Asticcacaulis sp. BYS171W]|uniref:Glycosyltransferase family 2 protein n=1 Tax=Asticcacaulis aquaticus TaxID=2984212 RepID=A0ABT5HZ48_9CAUL|nr:glycosyltransferase family 2 protein [Asticcacaulis aquaticus]MDC7684711.1 glycosyltransferase family 2 protein [Asticcacaulis aquaticus]